MPVTESITLGALTLTASLGTGPIINVRVRGETLALYAAIVVAALVLHAHDVVLGMRDTRPRARIVRRRRVR